MITIFTPTYNRASLLPRLYESLKRQGFRDFEWIIVDDGSTDNTKDMVCSFQNQSSAFPIQYFKKENGGKHTAVNVGVKKAQGELFFIADSDDMLTDDALQTIADEWESVKDNMSLGGLAGLDIAMDGYQMIGSGLPHDYIDCNAIDIRYRYHVHGDLKEVFRIEVLRQYPFPEIAGERFCPEQLIWFRIAQEYKLHYFNKPIYIAEYQAEGITAGIVRARMNSPIASCMTYAEMLSYDIPFIQRVKAAVNYWRFRLCLTKKGGERNRKYLPGVNGFWNVLFPIGAMMHWRDMRNMEKELL
ncbi:glycosyltransferase family A protein [Prevotella sp. KH2C16]|uniref:glycosyltransferase family 2 protein n=1 Tax=Prevotella sp. KH2C16 TaxID=1855325 RepID=UPI0008E33EA9|nr:glycosyltransferase family A protein [Prevotella sp. KH2C16]SFG53602.1 Glycosyl transferase family 2 [Prevotella sp. KH2C16]